MTAVLQLLAYLKLLKTHCNNSDSLKTLTKIHHSNARKKNFDWEAFAANPILLLRANDNYWSSFSRSTKRHIVGRIIDVCKKYGIQINLYKNETELIMKKENGQYTVAESYK